MNVGGALLGGVAGGLLGSLVWVGIGYATGYELGILAVGVGIACGIGVAMGTKGHAGTAGGVIAALCAIISIMAARYALVQIALDDFVREAMADNGSDIPGAENDEYWIAFIANRAIEEMSERGEELDWFPAYDEDYEEGDLASNYPPEIWEDAQSQWDNLSRPEREEFCAAATEMMVAEGAEDAESFRTIAGVIGGLLINLHPMALVLMVISVGTAFKVASTSQPVNEAALGASDSYLPSGEVPSGFRGIPAPSPDPVSGPTGLPGMPPPASSTGGPSRFAHQPPPMPGEAAAPTGLPGMPPPAPRKSFYASGPE